MMPCIFPKNGKGFTLTEAIIAVTIFVLIALAIFSTYNLNYRAYRESERKAEIIQNGRVILERITRETRQTKNIVTNLPDDEVDATNTIMFQDGHDISTIHYIHYFQDGTNIKREVLAFYFSDDPGTYVVWNAIPPLSQTIKTARIEEPKVIGEYVSGLGFWGAPVINISVSLEKQDQQINIKTAIFGRNI